MIAARFFDDFDQLEHRAAIGRGFLLQAFTASWSVAMRASSSNHIAATPLEASRRATLSAPNGSCGTDARTSAVNANKARRQQKWHAGWRS